MPGPPFLYNITLMLNRESETRRMTSAGHGTAVTEVMHDIAEKHADVYVWMVMPDHIHILFGRDDPLEDVDQFAGRIKRRINKAFERRQMHKLHWLDGCTKYEVKLETLRHARDYILANPVRAQFVKTPSDWVLSGTPAPLPAGS